MAEQILFSASLLATNLSLLIPTLSVLESFVNMIHFDVMDGKFVPNITFGSKFISDLRPHSTKIFDVHLMIDEPENHIVNFIETGADIITIHFESSNKIPQIISLIKENNKKVGIAINPDTPLQNVLSFLDKIDLLLIMTVHPGFCNQKFLSSQLTKIFDAKEFIIKQKLNCIIQVDGGINDITAIQAIRAGANSLVSGSFILNQKGFNVSEFAKLKKASLT